MDYMRSCELPRNPSGEPNHSGKGYNPHIFKRLDSALSWDWLARFWMSTVMSPESFLYNDVIGLLVKSFKQSKNTYQLYLLSNSQNKL